MAGPGSCCRIWSWFSPRLRSCPPSPDPVISSSSQKVWSRAECCPGSEPPCPLARVPPKERCDVSPAVRPRSRRGLRRQRLSPDLRRNRISSEPYGDRGRLGHSPHPGCLASGRSRRLALSHCPRDARPPRVPDSSQSLFPDYLSFCSLRLCGGCALLAGVRAVSPGRG